VLNKGFYVSNFEDGKIYHLNAAGTVVGTFDPFAADNGAAGFAPLGERVWAVQVYNTRELYFSVWLCDQNRSSPTWPTSWPPQGTNIANNAIFKVNLQPLTGAFIGGAILVKVMPPNSGQAYSNPVSDIAFSQNKRRMLTSERSMFWDDITSAHDSRVVEWTGGGPGSMSNAWVPFLPSQWWIGKYGFKTNSAGGGDYACDDSVLATADAMHLDSSTGDIDSIYGVQWIPAGGNSSGASTATSRLIDLDGEILLGGNAKMRMGDLEYMRASCDFDWYSYCTPKVNSQGCAPTISADGDTSMSSSTPFVVSCSQLLNNKTGLCFYGSNGPHNAPFQGGTLCVHSPLSRAPTQSSGGHPPPDDCSGSLSIDMKAFGQGLLGGNPQPSLSSPGATIDCQWWSRDPASASTTSLSDALEYVIEP
jgi:hypothetical protein